MSEGNASGSGAGAGSGGAPKAIASLAKKPADTTRAGTQRMKFTPTLPVRRKKEEVKQEAAAQPIPAASERGRGRGRGRGGERGRGRGAAPARPPPQEMVASGPFAMGPARAGSSGWRSTPRAAAPIVPMGPSGSTSHGAGLTRSAPPTLKTERVGRSADSEEELEAYSDPDEGVEIVDMANVRSMDWNAPESLRREKEREKKSKGKGKVKQEEQEVKVEKGKAAERGESMDVDGNTPATEEAADVNLANALDLSESEDEEEMDDLIEDFATHERQGEDLGENQERLYFFQFPEPFPVFVPSETPSAVAKGKMPEVEGKHVSFATDTKPPAAGTASRPESVDKEPEPPEHVDGIIGQLEIYQSGAVKMRLANGIVMDVSGATQPSFLQQAVHIDTSNKNLNVLGEVGRRFVVTPDLDTLLTAMTQAEQAAVTKFDDETLITMDTT
ncbi:hypothetical protein DENSPDRAFT_815390 [Dentipellis sp. KUC8613]|nr:hypothetical protein DENSPDRAFT_815390 [Dentipellis sp. KUC8613]